MKIILGKSEELWLTHVKEKKEVTIIKNDRHFRLIIFVFFILDGLI
jgi:hypothetical protein